MSDLGEIYLRKGLSYFLASCLNYVKSLWLLDLSTTIVPFLKFYFMNSLAIILIICIILNELINTFVRPNFTWMV